MSLPAFPPAGHLRLHPCCLTDEPACPHPCWPPQAEPLMDAGMDISGSVLFDSELLKMIKFD